MPAPSRVCRVFASAQFAGGDVDNWHAYALNDQSHAPVPWDADALFAYLRDGWHPDHGDVAKIPVDVAKEFAEADKRKKRDRLVRALAER